MYKRAYFQSVKERIEEPRMFIQVIAGPRQVGKSTLVSQVLQEISISYTPYQLMMYLQPMPDGLATSGKVRGLPKS